MLKPIAEWDESYILSLPKESNEFERKGYQKLDLTLPQADENLILKDLAKQLSAFANSGGGKIIYGVKNDGTIDGGVSLTIKTGGTKEWLERQISVLTEFEILGTNVFEIQAKSADSQIQPDRALYIVDVPDSERAPHQSRKDLLYYVRLNSQSQPASHRLIEDIRNRQKHPRLEWSDITLENLRVVAQGKGIYGIAFTLRCILSNLGPLKSTDTFIQFKLFDGQLNRQSSLEIMTIVLGTGLGVYQWELSRPLPPESTVTLQLAYSLNAAVESHPDGNVWMDASSRKPVDDVGIDWTIYADSAPPKRGNLVLGSFSLNSSLKNKLMISGPSE